MWYIIHVAKTKIVIKKVRDRIAIANNSIKYFFYSLQAKIKRI